VTAVGIALDNELLFLAAAGVSFFNATVVIDSGWSCTTASVIAGFVLVATVEAATFCVYFSSCWDWNLSA
jgi:hypothetical protein